MMAEIQKKKKKIVIFRTRVNDVTIINLRSMQEPYPSPTKGKSQVQVSRWLSGEQEAP